MAVLLLELYLRFEAKLGATGDRFGDLFCVDCAYLPCVSGRNQFTNQISPDLKCVSKVLAQLCESRTSYIEL